MQAGQGVGAFVGCTSLSPLPTELVPHLVTFGLRVVEEVCVDLELIAWSSLPGFPRAGQRQLADGGELLPTKRHLGRLAPL
jgi:hypothetical protein